MTTMTRLGSVAALVLCGTLLAPGAARADDKCIWKGHAPFCNGKCDPGYTMVEQDKSGEGGKKCVTGKKAKCCLTSAIHVVGKAPACNGKCPVDEETLGYQDSGENGQKCLTGKAAICRKG